MNDRHDDRGARSPASADDRLPREPADRQSSDQAEQAPSTQWSKHDHDAVDVRDRDETEIDAAEDETTRRPPWLAIVIALIAVAALLAWGVYGHWRQNNRAAQTQQDTTQLAPSVRVAIAKREADPVELALPGQTEAFQTAAIFGRATGYVSERRVDIGSRVKKGDLLVHIAAPDLDEQLAQAQAQLGQVNAALLQAQAQVTQAQASLTLQSTNLERTDTLTRQGFATVQNQQTQQTTVQSQQAALTTAQAGVKVAEANVRAQQATVDRLKALAAFEDVVAPFDGVVTARNVEVGDLVNADVGSGTPLFTVDEDDVLRVAVRVPQYSSEGVRDGLDAKVTAPEIAGRTFTGKVARSSVALLFSSRTLTAEVDVQNPDGALRPGLFVDVSIAIPRSEPHVSVPSEALIFNQQGMQVAVVGQDGRVTFHKVDVYRDLGTSVEVKNGLNGGEKLVMNAPVDLADGAKVRIEPDAPQQSAPKPQSN